MYLSVPSVLDVLDQLQIQDPFPYENPGELCNFLRSSLSYVAKANLDNEDLNKLVQFLTSSINQFKQIVPVMLKHFLDDNKSVIAQLSAAESKNIAQAMSQLLNILNSI
jgi:hypothetical protein